ncbi:MAG: hypothetical protein IJK04_14885 [Kiritimatiellae bacterium]|nr:hypothetical protein [Kiritimatiellia bacterium]
MRADLATLKSQIEQYNLTHPDRRILGIGEAKRMEFAAAFELVRRASGVFLLTCTISFDIMVRKGRNAL